jgi:hypothetical protein
MLKPIKSPTVFTFLLIFSVLPILAEDAFTAYLFAYFTGNNKSQEAIRFALSDDAHNFKALNNNNPVISSEEISSTGGIRDPHILRGENNDYYMVATDMVSANGWASNRGLVMLRSTNLIEWTSSAINIPKTFPVYSSADRVWAPQVIYDPEAGKYMVYFAMRLGPNSSDKIYYSYADSTFTRLETVPKLLFAYNNSSAIDADIIYKDSTYHLFFKTEGSGNGIKSATSKKLTEGYILYDKYLQVTNEAVEGSCVFRLIDSDTFILMYDVYISGKYEFAVSTDLKNFTKDNRPISFDFTPRHGTVIPITEKEKKALLAKWGPPVGTLSQSSMNYGGKKLHWSGKTLELSLETSVSAGVVSVVNLSGKEVYRHTVTGKVAIIQMSNMSSGVYHIILNSWATRIWCSRIMLR